MTVKLFPVRIFVLPVLVIVQFSELNCSAKTIGGWSASRGGDAAILTGGDFAGVRADRAAFFPDATLVATSELNAAFLSTVEVLLLDPVRSGADVPISPLTASEQAALTSWVAAGGRALIVGENASYYTASRSMIEPFGPQWANAFLAGTQNGTVTDHTSFAAITDEPFGTVTAFTGGFVSFFADPTPAIPLGTWNVNNKTALAAMNYGLGRVVFYCDNALLYDYGGTDNVKLRRNTLNYLLLIPEPNSLAVVGVGILLLAQGCRLRKRNTKSGRLVRW